MHTRLTAKLYGRALLTFDPGRGLLLGPDEVEAETEAWRLTGAWTPGKSLTGKKIERWLEGLLPEGGARSAQRRRGEATLERLGVQRAGYSTADLVWAAGQVEYPGAVTFESLLDEEVLLSPSVRTRACGEAELAEILQQVIEEMRKGQSDPRRRGYRPVSPSGSLPKFAAHRSPQDGLWYLPRPGRLSTHIIKQEQRVSFPAEAAIEAICQRTLRHVGVRAAATQATMIGRHQVIVSERGDREECGGRIHPIHQEEWINAANTAVDDILQYEGAEAGWKELRKFVIDRAEDKQTEEEHFWTMLSAITVLGHRDMHRRNIGIRYNREDEPYSAEIAPMYDVSSMDGQGGDDWRTLGMHIGETFDLDGIKERHWIRLATECETDVEQALWLVKDSARRVPDALEKAIEEARAEDRWANKAEAEARISVLRTETRQRARRTEVREAQAVRAPDEPEWIGKVLEAQEGGATIRVEANPHSRSLTVWAWVNGKATKLGHVKSIRSYCEGLRRAGEIDQEDANQLERTLEKQRLALIALHKAKNL